MDTNFDIIVIGSGPGGYTAAIRAAQLGYKVAIIEKYPTLGGTCTNVGCIPAKALLDSSEHFQQAKSQFARHGINLEGMTLDFEQFIARKRDVVKQNTAGLNYLMRKNKIQVFTGTASFISHQRIIVRQELNDIELESTFFIVATGSKPATIPGVEIDRSRIITSTEALSLPEFPRSMVTIGGGVIGVELASVYARIGTEVTILEYAKTLIPAMDNELGTALGKTLEKLNIKLTLGCRVRSAVNNGHNVTVYFDDPEGTAHELTADYCLVAVGRKPYTAGLELQNAGVIVQPDGTIQVNESLQTSAVNIYAIGDVIKGPMLAHKAEDEGAFVAEIINGQKHVIKYNLIPNVVYTWPEVASVGFTEEELRDSGILFNTGKFPFSASARARASMDTDGFIKVLSDHETGEVYGVHIIGPRAADVIGQATVAMEGELTVKELGRMTFAHPTYSEVLKNAYLIASGQGSIDI